MSDWKGDPGEKRGMDRRYGYVRVALYNYLVLWDAQATCLTFSSRQHAPFPRRYTNLSYLSIREDPGLARTGNLFFFLLASLFGFHPNSACYSLRSNLAAFSWLNLVCLCLFCLAFLRHERGNQNSSLTLFSGSMALHFFFISER
ncbi:hypothetical protein QBC42DRAFT_35569 [Cladorrhinum samala]|uniref:Uncharacterized protein n=1 Tax=Cladorrhinum samala TaxID=585594 RepID=A0AAV9HAI2_9PEZI|nr:hypothetical protein QBC42DRAFT_35569 [Cladorrhinum samala]